MSNQNNNSNAGNNNVNVINKNVNTTQAAGGAKTTGAVKSTGVTKSTGGAKKGGSNVQNDVSNAVSFCKRNVRYIAAAGLFGVIVFFLVKSLATNADDEPKNDPPVAVSTETEAATTETEQQEDYAVDAYPQINELVSNYYTAYANGDMDALSALTENMSETEKSYISVFSEQVEQYENISCYTKRGLDDTSYIVSVSLEMRFKGIDTTAPGLDFFYARTREDGSMYFDQRYGQYNLTNEEQELEPDVKAWIDAFLQQDDFIALSNQVEANYTLALESDEKLKEMAKTTIPDIIKIWKADQVAAAQKAEEEAAKKAEEEKKAAEEEAAKKAEEEKKAAELASAVTVYAIDNVNVRAEGSESAEIIGKLEVGAQTTRLEEKDGWSRIDYSNGTQGYVKSDYLSTDSNDVPAAAPEGEKDANGLAEWSTVTLKETVNIRESMSTDSAKVATAYAGEKVTVVMSYAEGWTKVSYNDLVGYIKTDLLK